MPERGVSPWIFSKRRIRTVNDAKAVLARLIQAFQEQRIDDTPAKTLTYMLISFVNICRDSDMEQRLTELETAINQKGGNQNEYRIQNRKVG